MKVIIIGSGIVGASTAYQLINSGKDVVMIDQMLDGAATKAGAGIICPWASRERGQEWYDIALAATKYYPTLINQLALDGEKDVSFKKVGALITSNDPETLDLIANDLIAERTNSPEMGEISRLTNSEAQAMFPPLQTNLEAVFIPGAFRLDGHELRNALMRSVENKGGQLIKGKAELVVKQNQVEVTINEEIIQGDAILIANGAWAPELLAPLGIEVNIESQRGQIAHLQLPNQQTADWPVVVPEGSGHYLVPFDQSRVVVGATREVGSTFDYRVTSGGLAEVLTEGLNVAPGLEKATLSEVRIGFRPMGPDLLPLLGPVKSFENLFIANGLGPSGLTMGPYIGKLAASLISGETLPIDLTNFNPDRAM